MSNLTIVPKWNENINQVEKDEFITGGVDGNANLAIRQLAENVFWLRHQFQQKAELGVNGSMTFPNGMVMQWGTVEIERFTESAYTLNFHTPFPTGCLNFVAMRKTQNAGDIRSDGGILLQTLSRTQAIVSLQSFNSEYGRDARGFTWLAVGH